MDVSDDEEDSLHLRMVLAPNQTPASKLLLQRRLEALPPDTGLPKLPSCLLRLLLKILPLLLH